METKELFFSPEEVQALSGYVGIKPGASWPYVPLVYRIHIKDKTKWPIYWLKAPDGIDQAKEEDHLGVVAITSEGKIDAFKTRSGELRVFRLRRNITAAKNHRTIDGSVIEFTTDLDEDGTKVASKAFIASIEKPLQIELDNAIKQKLELSPEEKMGLGF